MELEDARALLATEYKGLHTLMAYARPQTGSINKTSRFSKKNQAIYLFPDTLNMDGTVIAYVPAVEGFSVYDFDSVVPIKAVASFVEKQEEIEHEMESISEFVTDLYLFCEKLNNKYYQAILLNHMKSLVRKEPISQDRYKITVAVVKHLQRSHDTPMLDHLLETVENYQQLCKISSSIARRDKTVRDFIDRNRGVPALTRKQYKELRTAFKRACESSDYDHKELVNVVKAKIVAQVMFLAEVVNHREFFTYEELVEAIEEFRPDVIEAVPSGTLRMSIYHGIRKLIDDKFVEQHPMLNTYSLTSRCRALMLQLIEGDNAQA